SRSEVRVGGDGRWRSPAGLLTTSPFFPSASPRAGRTRNVTSRRAARSLAPKYPPNAPAPITNIRKIHLLLTSQLRYIGCSNNPPPIKLSPCSAIPFHQVRDDRL